METLREDVVSGLFSSPRSLPSKYFYDDEGSRYFDQICKTQDYYPTRTEAGLLTQYSKQIVELTKPKSCAELGAGTSEKTEILLTQLLTTSKEDVFTYLSMDVCEEVLVESAQRLIDRFPALHVESVVGEYIPAIGAAPNLASPTLFIFIGSSIGNFSKQESIELLSQVAKKMSADDYFLIGMDRVKDVNVLERAYDDSEGVTAKFNLNVLNVLNYKLGANFDLNNFRHQAIYNDRLQQIEMYLISQCHQKVEFAQIGKTLTLEKDEKILTEVSRKYSKKTISNLLTESGLHEVRHFEPQNEYFSLLLASKKP